MLIAAVRKLVPVTSAACLILSITACPGYVVMKKKDLDRISSQNPVIVVDSTALMMLRQQLASLHARYRADSVRLSDMTKNSATQDSLIRAKQAELDATKDQLNKANDELERIKRRLANPRS